MQHEDEPLSKPNRRRRLDPKKHKVVVGPPPPTGLHRTGRKQLDKQRVLACRRASK